MQVAENWSDMLAPSKSGDETSGRVLNRLQAAHQPIGYAVVQRVAVIQPTGDGCLDQSLGGILGQASNEWSQLPELVIATSTHGSNL